MAEPTQFSFDLKEAATALVKQQGLHEGHWMLSFEFILGAGIIGPSGAEAKPSALIQVNKLQLVKSEVPPQHPQVTVDAAEVNPAPTRARSSRRAEFEERRSNDK